MGKKEEIRDYKAQDVQWLKPIAEKYGEWGEISAVVLQPHLYRLRWAKVIEPYALLVLFEDSHGPMVAGLCDEKGIKSLVALCRGMNESVNGLNLHAHVEKDSWQERLYRRFNYIKEDNNGMLWR